MVGLLWLNFPICLPEGFTFSLVSRLRKRTIADDTTISFYTRVILAGNSIKMLYIIYKCGRIILRTAEAKRKIKQKKEFQGIGEDEL